MFPTEIKIRDLAIRPATILAPMAGVTDTVFRRVIRELGGCGLIMTEFTSAEGLTRNSARTLRYLYFAEDEHPIAAQIFGAVPEVMAAAAKLSEDLMIHSVPAQHGSARTPFDRNRTHWCGWVVQSSDHSAYHQNSFRLG